HRNPAVDVGLAALALLGIAISAGYTRRVVWAASPPRPEDHPLQKCARVIAWVTMPTILLFAIAGGVLAFRHGGWPALEQRIFDWRISVVFVAYCLWALMQQT